jgi:hypothetical protein
MSLQPPSARGAHHLQRVSTVASPDADLVWPPLRCSMISSSSAFLSRFADTLTAPPATLPLSRRARLAGWLRAGTYALLEASASQTPR